MRDLVFGRRRKNATHRIEAKYLIRHWHHGLRIPTLTVHPHEYSIALAGNLTATKVARRLCADERHPDFAFDVLCRIFHFNVRGEPRHALARGLRYHDA